MGGGFCTTALWDCITVAPCPHGEKASHKNLVSFSFSPLSFPHPASPYLSLHLCLPVSAAVQVGLTDGWTRSNLTAAISVTAKKRSRKGGQKKHKETFLFVFVVAQRKWHLWWSQRFIQSVIGKQDEKYYKWMLTHFGNCNLQIRPRIECYKSMVCKTTKH